MSYTRDQLENWLKTIEVDCDKFLDVGAGGNPVKNRLAKCKSQVYETLDFNKKNDPDYIWDLNYFKKPEEIFQFDKYPFYDVIAAIEISEYLWNELAAMQNLTNWLNAGGELLMSFHFVYPIHPPEGIDYSRFTRNKIEKLFRLCKFHQVDITPRVATKGLEYLKKFYQAEGMHYQKGDIIADIGYLVRAKK